MTFHRDRTRADGTGEDSTESAADDCDESAADHREATTAKLTADQHREWRRWIVELVCGPDYGVVPVDHLVEEIVQREPGEIDRSTVRQALTETLLPVLDRESVLEYDTEQHAIINYGDPS